MTKPPVMPRLSVDLKGPKHPNLCQSCGVAPLPGLEAAPADITLTVWREHDEDDVPENVFIVLCKPCEKRLIQPHPRLYDYLQRNAPAPGVMPVCILCRFREGVKCTHPDLKANGGPGLPLVAYAGAVAHINYGGGRGGWIRPWTRPVECAAFEEEI